MTKTYTTPATPQLKNAGRNVFVTDTCGKFASPSPNETAIITKLV
jgi:hypothetical protein